MHYHQAESGMKEGRERDGVARRPRVTEIMKLVGNEEKIIPVKKKKVSIKIIVICYFIYG